MYEKIQTIETKMLDIWSFLEILKDACLGLENYPYLTIIELVLEKYDDVYQVVDELSLDLLRQKMNLPGKSEKNEKTEKEEVRSDN